LQRLLHEGVGSQCVHKFRSVDVPARVLGKPVQDEVQQFDILIAPVLLDGPGIVPGPTIEIIERDDALEETGKLPAQVRR
jgi:hypothetical protein